MSNQLDQELRGFREWRARMLQQFGIRTWDSLFAIGKCTKCGEEKVASIGSVIGIQFGRFDRFENQLLKMVDQTPPCKKCKGQTQPTGLMYCSYYPEIKVDLNVLLRLSSAGEVVKEYSKVGRDGVRTVVGSVSDDGDFRQTFGLPFSVRGEWVRIVRDAVRSHKPQSILIQDGYIISCWPSSMSPEEKTELDASIDEFRTKHHLNFGDYLVDGPKRNVEVKESFEAWLDDFADPIRKNQLNAFGFVSSEIFVDRLKREFPEYTFEFPEGFNAVKSPMFRCRKGDFYLDASMASFLVTAIHRGLSFERVARDFFATTILDRLDLMVELLGKLGPVFSDYRMSVGEGRNLQLRAKSTGQILKSWDLYEFADEFTVDFPRFLREKMNYDLSSKKFTA